MRAKVTRTMLYNCLVLLQAAIILQAQIELVQATDTPFLVYTNRDEQTRGVSTANLDGSNVQVLVDNMTASGLDFDYRDNTLFWSDVENERIYRANVNGSDRTVLTNAVDDPEIIGWDWINKKLYWTDVSRGTLEVMDPETGFRKVLLRVGLAPQIRGLQLDPVNRWMYWTTITEGFSRIARTSMDGTGTEILLNSSTVFVPNGVTLDSDTLYWVDASRFNSLIGRTGTTPGSEPDKFFRFPMRKNPFHATFYNGELYYTDWIDRSVSKLVNINTNPSTEQLIAVGSKAGMVKVFSAVNQPRVDGDNPCDGVDCMELCLLSGTDPRGYTCACNGNVEINPDNRTCGEVPTTEPTTAASTTMSTTTLIGSPNPPPGLCDRITCMNGGTCFDIPQNFVCQCPPTWTGTLCETQVLPPEPAANDNSTLLYVFIGIGILAFMAFVTLGLVVFVYWTVKVRTKRNKHKRPSSIDGMSMSSRDSLGAHYILVNHNGRMTEHDYMSIKSRGNSPAPSRILICNVGDQGSSAYPNNYSYFEQPPPHILPPLPRNGTQTLEYMYPATHKTPTPVPQEPIYNTVKSEKRQTL